VAGQAVNDAYNGLKALIKRKSVGNPEAEMVPTQYEQDPDVWVKPMTTKLDQTGTAQDPEIQKAAQQLLDQLKAQPGGAQYVQIKPTVAAMPKSGLTSRANNDGGGMAS
jgi:hypothetical protein